MSKEDKKETKYLYGAAVQGIQNFIFQTNKLKEIVGASELVEQICTTAFDDYGGKVEEGKSVLRAAGNIKHIFDAKEDCEKTVFEFPRKVMTMAPGITISQAVVSMPMKTKEGNLVSDYETISNELEQRLRTQRNKAVRSMTLGLMAISRTPSTGLPAVDEVKRKYSDSKEIIDAGSKEKLDTVDKKEKREKEKNFDKSNVYKDLMDTIANRYVYHNEIAYDLEKLEGDNSWLAVIHADGNGMGMIVQEVCKNADYATEFSRLIDEISKESAHEAYKNVEEECQKKKKLFLNDGVIPLRPVVLGGDDLTLICRADLAVDFTRFYMENFEKFSKDKFNSSERIWKDDLGIKDVVKNGLTVCAGISFIKSSYPFHYAVKLAESLCKRAKKAAKKIDSELAPSCLMFHKVQDSFVEDFNEIAKRELTPQLNLSFECGPYYCGKRAEQYADGTLIPKGEKAESENCKRTIEQLLQEVSCLDVKESNAIKSHFRQWLSLLFDNVDAANQKMKRLRAINVQAKNMIAECFENLSENEEKKIPYHDILSLTSILTQETKKGGNKHEQNN
ncbi:hypothetical protein AGMMS49574_05340 [Bacteroidia bacterium]|nr:hypothetical protein AGMMS49574_05340 [Bacteroidia bacterium]